MAFQSYHQIWLENHPQYDEEWLAAALKAGFDIHHLDGDHFNDNPDNLLLVETTDHQRLHGRINRLFGNGRRGHWHTDKNWKATVGGEAYKMREAGWKWPDIGREFGYKNPTSYAINVAKAHAEYYGKQWPIPHVESCSCTKCASK